MDYKRKLFTRTIASLEGFEPGSVEVIIRFTDGSYIQQEHVQDCCEDVSLYQVDGNIQKHIGATAIDFIKKSTTAEDAEVEEYGTWTFYTLITSKGYLDWRWLGESNGYYSEDVDSTFYEKKALNS